MTSIGNRDLSALLDEQGEALLARWRDQVKKLPSAASLTTPALNDHIPSLIDEIGEQLRESSVPAIPLDSGNTAVPSQHGVLRLAQGFDLEEVVAEYGVLRTCILDLIEEAELPLESHPLRAINHTIDSAIAYAAQAYAEEQALQIQSRREEHLVFVAHDLRTPLNAIALAAAILEHKVSDLSDDDESHRLMATLQRNTHQLQGLVSTILEESTQVQYAGDLRVERREFDLWPMVELLLLDLLPLAQEQQVELRNQVPQELRVFADAAMLRRIFQNLLTNAIRHADDGEIRVGAEPQPDGVECWVLDGGRGIPADRMASLFDREEAGEKHDGHGFGLQIVKRFVEAHGGEIRVESAGGTRFSFRLPAKEPPHPS